VPFFKKSFTTVEQRPLLLPIILLAGLCNVVTTTCLSVAQVLEKIIDFWHWKRTCPYNHLLFPYIVWGLDHQ